MKEVLRKRLLPWSPAVPQRWHRVGITPFRCPARLVGCRRGLAVFWAFCLVLKKTEVTWGMLGQRVEGMAAATRHSLAAGTSPWPWGAVVEPGRPPGFCTNRALTIFLLHRDCGVFVSHHDDVLLAHGCTPLWLRLLHGDERNPSSPRQPWPAFLFKNFISELPGLNAGTGGVVRTAEKN